MCIKVYMANEAVKVNPDHDVHYFTITNQPIPKGTLMVISDPRTVTPHNGVAQIAVGVTVEEIKAGDGQVRVGVRGRGIFDMIADGAITVGDLVTAGTATNDVRAIRTAGGVSSEELNRVIGVALETASDNEVIQVLLRCF